MVQKKSNNLVLRETAFLLMTLIVILALRCRCRCRQGLCFLWLESGLQLLSSMMCFAS